MSIPRRSQAGVVESVESVSADQISFLIGLVCPVDEDCARQEFKPDTDVETVLRRHGGAVLRPSEPSAFKVFDYDVDLSAALRLVSEAKAEYAAAPPDIRKRFPDFMRFMEAVGRGWVGVRDADPPPSAPNPQDPPPA